MSRIVECDRSDWVEIHNPNDHGNPLSAQIPADFLYSADAVLQEMCRRGETSPALVISRTVEGTGFGRPSSGAMWVAEYGGKRAVGVTPWSAIKELCRKIDIQI